MHPPDSQLLGHPCIRCRSLSWPHLIHGRPAFLVQYWSTQHTNLHFITWFGEFCKRRSVSRRVVLVGTSSLSWVVVSRSTVASSNGHINIESFIAAQLPYRATSPDEFDTLVSRISLHHRCVTSGMFGEARTISKLSKNERCNSERRFCLARDRESII